MTLTCPPMAVASPGATTAMLACFSIDVEEYYHAEVFAGRVPADVRAGLPHRAQAPLETLFDLLSVHGSRATLFVLGEVALDLRSTLRRFADAGHEIACHGDGHVHLARLTPQEFRADLRRARRRIEDALGVAVRGYRAPTFSITRRTAWALDVLIDEGFSYDASIFPIHHDRYGVPDAPDGLFLAASPSGRTIIEFPPLTVTACGVRLPVGGGGYLRLLPATLVAGAFRRAAEQGRPAMLYVHPWELDPGQPRLPAGALATWRHRVGMSSVVGKLERILAEVRFDTAQSVIERIQSASTLSTFSIAPARL